MSDMEKKDREGGTEQQEFNQLLEEPSVKPFIIDTAELQSTYILSFPTQTDSTTQNYFNISLTTTLSQVCTKANNNSCKEPM